MNHLQLTMMCLLGLLPLSGCGSESDQSETTSELEQDFLTSIESAEATIADYARAPDQARARDTYHARLTDRLNDMASSWEQMRLECQRIGAECPAGGGVTSTASAQCTSGGHLMTRDRMGQLMGYIDACQWSLDEFWSACGTDWASQCPDMAEYHRQETLEVLSQMAVSCTAWWSEGGMMHSDHPHRATCE